MTTYSDGTLTISPGSNVINGSGTAFKENLVIGSILEIPGIPQAFRITQILDDAVLNVTPPIPGTGTNISISGLVYFATTTATNFTPVLNLPMPGPNMLNVQGVINRAFGILDNEMPSSVKGLISHE